MNKDATESDKRIFKKDLRLYKNDNHSRFIDLVDYDSLSPVILFSLIENSLLDCESKQI